ncbi:hypothetical protein KEM48_004919 [Puccinia striiformis f. sp. tritici PST-130]|uniref:Coenzyme Q-binding protein COQ10 START domain-containing protein n=2 Tax=Puccinia striiformis f. sp. tritici TaxID=168172 RepID=A0A0L0UVD8_9BASI|nr:hypothetical protein KEM48_004919 [Puccinia striiformis f. sp. tritici PST-130]KNE90997.1 hypothetical protein PSTG_15562 [Puccinia striiformis f. sp. tritici PST-78]
MYHRNSSVARGLTRLLPQQVSGARLTSPPLTQRQAMIKNPDENLYSRTFFSLPSFPPSKPSEGEVSSVQDLSVKDRYSKQGDLLVYKETKRLPYTKEQLYGVIADVEAYPQFVPFCTGSNLYSVKTLGDSSPSNNHDTRVRPWLAAGYSGETHLLESELSVGFKSFEEKYISHVECRKWDTVKATASHSKLFKHLTSTWTFKSPAEISFPQSVMQPNDPSQSNSTYISLHLAFAFSSPVHAAISELFWKAVSERMVLSFEARVRRVHGTPTPKA